MANLIIKSSADNLVLQGSDASPAITVGATGTTTFAEAATMSGNCSVAGNLDVTGTLPSGVPKIDLFSYILEDAPTTASTNLIASFDFTPTRNSTKQIYWWNIVTRAALGHDNSNAHIYIYIDIYDNTNSATKINAQVLAGGSFPQPSDNGNYVGIGSHVTSTTALTSGVSYKMRIYNASSGTNYIGTNDAYGNDLTMTALCLA